MKTKLGQLALAIAGLVAARAAGAEPGAPARYRLMLREGAQALVVTTPDWNSVDGTLRRFEKSGGAWRPAGTPVPVVVGKSGLAWDAVSMKTGAGTDPVKREGDGRSPAGVFRITREFGYDPHPASGAMPYLPLTDQTECVDDGRSKFYNQVVNRNEAADWRSSEKMRSIEEYKLGLIVAYNPNHVAAAGSCIFLHIWRGPGHGTAGCTAMEEASLREIALWLNETKRPVLIQLPEPVYQALRTRWGLP